MNNKRHRAQFHLEYDASLSTIMVIKIMRMTVEPGPIGEKQAQWLTLQSCPVTVGVTKWIECNLLNHLFETICWRQLTLGSVPCSLRGVTGKKVERDDDEDDD